MSQELGPLVRIWGLTTAQLPAPSATADELAPFLISILQEAVPFIDSAAPKATGAVPDSEFWKAKGTKTFSGADGPVEVSERVVPTAELELIASRSRLPHGRDGGKLAPETWACRRSVHDDAARAGTASWAEFRDAFQLHHAVTEEKFTPNVLGAHEALRWDCSGVPETEEGGERWGEFGLAVEEMKHKVGGPLSKRVFSVVQMTAAAKGQAEFLVVSIPVTDMKESEHATYSKEKGVVLGTYASVERIRKMDDGRIEWIMATASDAKGVLPLWVQTMAVGGVVAKDVALFLNWIARERTASASGEPATVTAMATAKATEPPAVVAGETPGLVTAENPST